MTINEAMQELGYNQDELARIALQTALSVYTKHWRDAEAEGDYAAMQHYYALTEAFRRMLETHNTRIEAIQSWCGGDERWPRRA